MVSRKPTISYYLSERELCQILGCKKISSARWIGTPGDRKLVVRGTV